MPDSAAFSFSICTLLLQAPPETMATPWLTYNALWETGAGVAGDT